MHSLRDMPYGNEIYMTDPDGTILVFWTNACETLPCQTQVKAVAFSYRDCRIHTVLTSMVVARLQMKMRAMRKLAEKKFAKPNGCTYICNQLVAQLI